jgi:hypothetical protein
MGAPDAIPDLQLSHPDGTPLTRIEADQYIRETLRKVHWLRILANKKYGLPKQYTFGMTELMVRHWFLDEAIRRGELVGDQVGVNLQNYNDENEQRQFAQRLAAMIQAGQAVHPKEGEGIDMSNIPQPPPGAPSNGQPPQPQGFIPPPPPPMGVAGPPQQGFVPPQPQAQPYMPPATQGPPQGYVPQPPPMPQQVAPPMAPPMMPPGYAPPPGAPPMMPQAGPPQMPPGPPQAPPPQAAPATSGRRGRGKAAEPAPQAAAPQGSPPMPPQGAGGFIPPMPQQPFAPLPQAQVPQVPMAPMPQATTAPAMDIGPLLQKVEQLTQTVAVLNRRMELSNMAITVLSRAIYRADGSNDIEGWLKEIRQIPQ